jgi:hydrogenase maturation protein HypF
MSASAGVEAINRRRVRVLGVVQGVGFRPFVYRLAVRHGIAGWVRNRSGIVEIEIEGLASDLDKLLCALIRQAPPLARVESVESVELTPMHLPGAPRFRILSSERGDDALPTLPVDTSTCAVCLQEMFDPQDRRYRYPFINCTDCGPRFTIIEALPYDRPRTTMDRFEMCSRCRAEYYDPQNRRFHAEPNACPDCGPTLRLLDLNGHASSVSNPLAAAAARLREGAVVAVKGLGGYHLAVLAADEQAVERLRHRKRRDEKPLALMAPDLATVRRFCRLEPEAEALLTSLTRPIVLLPRAEPAQWRPGPGVAPGLAELGVMLPYTGLHHLLLAELADQGEETPVIVLTSGNPSEEPIAFHDDEALSSLKAIADCFLTHDRPIRTPCDDSVVRPAPPVVVRRSRGFAPEVIPLPFDCPEPVLAGGAHLKNTFCIGRGRHAYVSQHLGDLESYETLRLYRGEIERMQRLLNVRPRVIAHDLHPDYASTAFALEQAGRHIPVQHHHAHIAGVLAEHGLAGQVIGVALDGAGWGDDGCIWGGEFLVADLCDFRRAAHLRYVPLPGGEQAVRQPWRMAASYLQHAVGPEWVELDLPCLEGVDRERRRQVRKMMERGVGCPRTSSAGRLFDAVAALALGREGVSYEGQAAALLEAAVEPAAGEGYRFTWSETRNRTAPLEVDAAPVIRSVLADLGAGVPVGDIAGRFHTGVVSLIVEVCGLLRRETGLERVALSGGVFQNAFLLRETLTGLQGAGFDVFTNRRVPPNDGGISLGQAAVAAARLETEHVPGHPR